MKETILNLWQENVTFSIIIQCDAANDIIHNTEILKSSLCDYNDDHILVKANITTKGHQQHNLCLKNVHHLLNVLQNLME